MNGRGQGSLEYLLIIGAALIIAIIVIAVVTGLGSKSNPDTELAELEIEKGKCLNDCCYGITADHNCQAINPDACILPDKNSNYKTCTG